MAGAAQYDIVVHNGTVLTVNESFEIIENGRICIRGGTIDGIEAAGTGHPPPDARTVIDAEGGIIMPGLVNTHTHVPMTLFRGLADDLPLDVWLNEHIFPAEAEHITPEFVRWASLLACAEMALGGTTTCCDGYFFEGEVARAIDEFGLRAVAGQGIIDFPAPGVPDPSRNLAVARDFATRLAATGGSVSASLFCHSPYTCSADTLRGAKSLADELGVLFQIHVAETKQEVDRCIAEHSMSPIRYLDRLGVLDDRTLLIHAVWVDAEDIGRIAERQCTVSHNPESNMKLGAGVAPVDRMLAAGITVGLGTDGCASNNNMDLFREMDTAAKIHKAATGDPTALDAKSVIRMATIEGARAIGLDDRVGSLAAGKQADLIIINTRRPHLTPIYRPESHVVYAAGAADVDTVIAGGRLLVKERNLLTVDADQILAAAGRQSRQVADRRKTHRRAHGGTKGELT